MTETPPAHFESKK